MPNLSLVDLPGLRQVDEESSAGLKEKVLEMVNAIIAADNSIVLAVAPAAADPATWVGRGLAKKVDPEQQRTVGVVTKVDTIFSTGGAETQENLGHQKTLRGVIAKEKNTPYFAAYNPSAEDETIIGDVSSKVQDCFEPGRVGNPAITQALEVRLDAHVTQQLPVLHERFVSRLAELESELHMDAMPSWQLVEYLLLTYSRLVQSYAQNKVAHPDGVVAPGLRGIWKGESFQISLDSLLNRFLARISPAAVYQDPGSAGSILCQPTQDLLTTLHELGISLDAREKYGAQYTKEHRKSDAELARDLGLELSTMLRDLSGQVLEDLEEEVFKLTERFYATVAEVQFTLGSNQAAKDSQRPKNSRQRSRTGTRNPSFFLAKYSALMKVVRKATDRLLENTWEKILQQAETEFADPTISDVNAAFMSLEDVSAALKRICML